jgi:Na+-driven multidrug efflux pump
MIAHADGHIDAANNVLGKIEDIILFPLMSLMMAVALLVFLYGGLQFIAGSADETKRATGKKHMLWGIIGMVVMTSAYAILRIALGTIGCDVDDLGGCG